MVLPFDRVPVLGADPIGEANRRVGARGELLRGVDVRRPPWQALQILAMPAANAFEQPEIEQVAVFVAEPDAGRDLGRRVPRAFEPSLGHEDPPYAYPHRDAGGRGAAVRAFCGGATAVANVSQNASLSSGLASPRPVMDSFDSRTSLPAVW